MAQLSYGFGTPRGVAGGLFDISYHEVNTRVCEEADGKMKFGSGVVTGTSPGQSVKLPESSAAKDFEGVVINGVNVEQDMKGNLIIKENSSVGVIRVGKVWARLHSAAKDVKYGNDLYLIVAGNEAGSFSNSDAGDTDTDARVKIKGKFIGEADEGIAPVLFPNEMNV